MSVVKPVRGTHDLIGEDSRRHQHVIQVAKKVTSLYGFEEWTTPVFEETTVFARSLGETSDVVSKEMYCFEDRGGDSLTLRPEGTAGICRALVTNGLTQSLPQKAFYAGPMFRYERPQKGRYRQFHQIGAELLGTSTPFADAEMIAMGYHILRELGIADDVVLELNTLGDVASRKAWREALISYFQAFQSKLSEDSRNRLEKNPLRILDSKAPEDRALLANAPALKDHMTPEAQNFWDQLRVALDQFNIPFKENPYIVRGLDYYSHTVFEFVTTKLGAQGTVLAGGRYEGLVEEMGGPSVPSIGWAAGVERLALLLEESPKVSAPVVIIPLSDDVHQVAFSALQALRYDNIYAEVAYKGNLRKQMERANKQNAPLALLIGEDEAQKQVVQVKDLISGEQAEVALADLVAHCKMKLAK
ncbi:histidine--tRNA ligase [Commensalibacter nepenthis]|uniref:Histidine--tRNA ligase n=1 Tax=Commensalibacter nepenthis TaxID=3043872 RepID=A0ABT6Q7Z3_9PROT|nr:histidine--tRNA ligase [Commensalibacter sp. TBRC 10068]MDI2113023.1 histidine--tRNA ligase [Commensalibacter sp. TBRC 10068]